MKPILVVDSFINDKNQERLLSNFLDSIFGIYKIILISNSKINSNILDKVDYFFYDKKNNLFENEYNNYESFYLWNIFDKFKIHTLFEHKQKHGLSVLINLFRSLEFAKELDFTHFIRVESDAIFGKNTLEDYKNFFVDLQDTDKKLKFYINENNKTQSFQYFGGEIEFFLKNFNKIKNENDYVSLIKNEYGKLDFVSVEKLMYTLIKKLPKHNVIIYDDLSLVLNDTIWNQSSSKSHLPKNMEKCQTNLYNIKNDNRFILYSKSNTKEKFERKVVLKTEKSELVFDYYFENFGNWYVEYLDDKVIHMTIFDNNKVIYNESIKEIKNIIELL